MIPILPSDLCGFIFFGEIVWNYTEVHRFQAVAALGVCNFPIIFLDCCGFIYLERGGCPGNVFKGFPPSSPYLPWGTTHIPSLTLDPLIFSLNGSSLQKFPEGLPPSSPNLTWGNIFPLSFFSVAMS